MKEAFEKLETKTKSLKQKFYNIKNDFQHKRLLLKELSRNFEIALKNTFMALIFMNNKEENEQIMLLFKFREQRKQVRN